MSQEPAEEAERSETLAISAPGLLLTQAGSKINEATERTREHHYVRQYAVSSRLSRGTQQPLAFWGAADIRWLAKTIDSVENDPYRPTLSLHPDRRA